MSLPTFWSGRLGSVPMVCTTFVPFEKMDKAGRLYGHLQSLKEEKEIDGLESIIYMPKSCD